MPHILSNLSVLHNLSDLINNFFINEIFIPIDLRFSCNKRNSNSICKQFSVELDSFGEINENICCPLNIQKNRFSTMFWKRMPWKISRLIIINRKLISIKNNIIITPIFFIIDENVRRFTRKGIFILCYLVRSGGTSITAEYFTTD